MSFEQVCPLSARNARRDIVDAHQAFSERSQSSAQADCGEYVHLARTTTSKPARR
jgi:hypothetical protein